MAQKTRIRRVLPGLILRERQLQRRVLGSTFRIEMIKTLNEASTLEFYGLNLQIVQVQDLLIRFGHALAVQRLVCLNVVFVQQDAQFLPLPIINDIRKT